MFILLEDHQPKIISQLIALETSVFGDAALNYWSLVPLIRHGRVFCRLEAETVVAAASYLRDWKNHRHAYLVSLVVAPGHHNRGLGTELLEASLLQLAGEGVSTVELTVALDNLPARKVYQQKLKFAADSIRADEYGPGQHRLILKKQL